MTINKVLSHWTEVGEGQENLMLESMSYSTKTGRENTISLPQNT